MLLMMLAKEIGSGDLDDEPEDKKFAFEVANQQSHLFFASMRGHV